MSYGMMATRPLAQQAGPPVPPHVYRELRKEGRLRWRFHSPHWFLKGRTASAVFVVSTFARVEREYEVTECFAPEVRRLSGYVFDARELERVSAYLSSSSFGGRLLVSRKPDPPWDLFALPSTVDIPYTDGLVRLGSPLVAFARGTPAMALSWKRVREDGMLEEATNLECWPAHVESVEERVVSERSLRRLRKEDECP